LLLLLLENSFKFDHFSEIKEMNVFDKNSLKMKNLVFVAQNE
jgi:hypothetical protein